MNDGFKIQMKMHLNRGSNGHTYLYELVDHPEVTITVNNYKKTRTSERIICFGAKEFKTIQEAVAACKASKGVTDATRT